MKINGNNVLKQMALFIFQYLQNWSWNRGRYDPRSNRSRSGGFPNWILTTVTSCFWILVGHVEGFATRYRERRTDENSGRTCDIRRLSVRAQTLRIEGIGHGDRCEWIPSSGLPGPFPAKLYIVGHGRR